MDSSTATALRSIQIWPVIHLADQQRRPLAQYNAELALDAGCHGVFLIHMRGDDEATMQEAQWMRATFPGLRVGVNLLATPADRALALSLGCGLAATWSDSPGVTSSAVSPVAHAVEAQLAANPDHLFFGSVAFKYQSPEPDPPVAAVRAAEMRMLATTSGPATGTPPDLGKLLSMRNALGSRPLAVASGVTPENFATLCAPLTHVLVSTGISRSFHQFDPQRLSALMQFDSRRRPSILA